MSVLELKCLFFGPPIFFDHFLFTGPSQALCIANRLASTVTPSQEQHGTTSNYHSILEDYPSDTTDNWFKWISGMRRSVSFFFDEYISLVLRCGHSALHATSVLPLPYVLIYRPRHFHINWPLNST